MDQLLKYSSNSDVKWPGRQIIYFNEKLELELIQEQYDKFIPQSENEAKVISIVGDTHVGKSFLLANLIQKGVKK